MFRWQMITSISKLFPSCCVNSEILNCFLLYCSLPTLLIISFINTKTIIPNFLLFNFRHLFNNQRWQIHFIHLDYWITKPLENNIFWIKAVPNTVLDFANITRSTYFYQVFRLPVARPHIIKAFVPVNIVETIVTLEPGKFNFIWNIKILWLLI